MKETSQVVALALRSRERQESSLNRDLQKGANRYTEHYAYPHILYVSEKSTEQRLLRIAALVASSSIKQNDDKPFGVWVRDNQANNTETRILRLTSLSFEQVVAEIARILRSIKTTESDTGFNWYDLADTLFLWGKGVTDSSLRTRQKILRDFYRVEPKPQLSEANENEDGEEEANDDSE